MFIESLPDSDIKIIKSLKNQKIKFTSGGRRLKLKWTFLNCNEHGLNIMHNAQSVRAAKSKYYFVMIFYSCSML